MCFKGCSFNPHESVAMSLKVSQRHTEIKLICVLCGCTEEGWMISCVVDAYFEYFCFCSAKLKEVVYLLKEKRSLVVLKLVKLDPINSSSQ